MHQIDLSEAQSLFIQLINEVLNGEEVVLTKNEIPVVKLSPIKSRSPKPKFGSAKGLITISDDFDEPLEDFQEYMG